MSIKLGRIKALLFILLTLHDNVALSQVVESLELANESLKQIPAKTRQLLVEYRKAFSQWDRTLRGFRRAHNLSVLSGAGKAYTKGHIYVADVKYPYDFRGQSTDLSVEYAFHLQLHRKLGYFVGTRFGGIDVLNMGQTEGKAQYVMQLPGLRAGFVWNMSSVWRASIGGQLSLLRYWNLRPIPDLQNRLSLTLSGGVVDFGLDWFYSLTQAIHFEYQYYKWGYTYEETIGIERSGHSISLGIVSHLI